MTDKSTVLTGPSNKMPLNDNDKQEKDKKLTTREIQAGPPEVGDDAWLPS